MESEGDGDGAEDRQRQERKEGRSYHDNYRHNPSFGSIILEDLYTSSGRIIILPIGGYLHVLTFLSGLSRYITKFIAGCDAWNQTKTFPMQKVGKLIPNQCWQVISVDMIRELLDSKGYNAVLVVVD